MFLVEIDEDTGLVSEIPANSGWKAIKAFNNIDKKKRNQRVYRSRISL